MKCFARIVEWRELTQPIWHESHDLLIEFILETEFVNIFTRFYRNERVSCVLMLSLRSTSDNKFYNQFLLRFSLPSVQGSHKNVTRKLCLAFISNLQFFFLPLLFIVLCFIYETSLNLFIFSFQLYILDNETLYDVIHST